MLNRTPGSGAYARTEREQRWLLSERPDDVAESVEIRDRYFTGSTLRLRRMRSDSDSETVHKLGQKVRVSSHSPERVSLTNMYLTEDEFVLLEQLNGATLTKTRWAWPTGNRMLVVDEIKGPLEGLILAEVELAGDEEFLPSPHHAVADVTSEDRYSGGSLAHLTLDGATALLADVAELVQRGRRP